MTRFKVPVTMLELQAMGKKHRKMHLLEFDSITLH